MSNPNPMAPIVRGSTGTSKETLEDLYKNVNTKNRMASMRGNLTQFDLRGIAWAQAKLAGGGDPAHNMDPMFPNTRLSIQSNFTPRQGIQNTMFTGDKTTWNGRTGALGQARAVWRLDSTKYHG